MVCVLLLSAGTAKAQDIFVNHLVIYSTDPQQSVSAVTDSVFTIKQIDITGNRRTRRSTILRELPYGNGDSYPFSEITKKLEQTKRQLMNTNLFRKVTVDLSYMGEQEVGVTVQVEEKWYFFPQPFVRLANGSFSQWTERGRPLSHLNYGIKLTQFNFTGRGDKLHAAFAEGYTKRLALQYQGFYFDRALKWSGSLNFSHNKNREVNYNTQYDKIVAVKNPDGFLFENYQASFDLVYRPAIKTRHQFTVGYQYNHVGDTVRKLNENYSPADGVFAYPYISYGISFIDYDFNPYPTRGRYGDASILRAGINSSINLWQLSARGVNYWGLGKKSYFSLKVGGVLKLPFKQPYISQQFLGYGDAFLQGYENYIIDGVAGAYAKQTFGVNVLKTEIPLPSIKWLKQLSSVPLRVYAKAYTNQGYVHNPNPNYTNGLTNRMLYSTGFGIDIIAFTDLIFKFEYSFNQLGQRAMYLHQ